MKILRGGKDGGTESRVWCWGFESKSMFSVLLLKFGEGSREAYHTHAFNAISWVLRGALMERYKGGAHYFHEPRLKPVITRRETFHKVSGLAPSTWVLTLRGPWVDQWREFLPALRKYVTLTHGRKEVV
jgi:hypothetical protein